MPLRAASAVRTLARTDTFMPMYPARPDSTAPMAKPIAVYQLRNTPTSTNSTAPATAMVRYCRLR